MSLQILLNLTLAFVWVFLTGNWTMQGFLLGYSVGLACIFFLRRYIPYRFYVIKIYYIVRLLLLFLKELIVSSLMVVKQVIRPKLDMQPGIFCMETELKTDWEMTLLSLLITLTPGTVTMVVEPQKNKLYIHAIDVPDAEQAILSIKESFEKSIMEVTRK